MTGYGGNGYITELGCPPHGIKRRCTGCRIIFSEAPPTIGFALHPDEHNNTIPKDRGYGDAHIREFKDKKII